MNEQNQKIVLDAVEHPYNTFFPLVIRYLGIYHRIYWA